MLRPSYDLVVNQGDQSWHWTGAPMTEVGPLHKRVKRLRKQSPGAPISWRIVLMQLDSVTGEVTLEIVAEGSA